MKKSFENFLDSRNKKNKPKDKNKIGKVKTSAKSVKTNRKPSV